MRRFQPNDETVTDGYISGHFYAYKGESNEIYTNGQEYLFLGTVRCSCTQECVDSLLMFLGNDNKVMYYPNMGHVRVPGIGLVYTCRLFGDLPENWCTEQEMILLKL